jgi:hypothetical protein
MALPCVELAVLTVHKLYNRRDWTVMMRICAYIPPQLLLLVTVVSLLLFLEMS